MKTQRRRGFTVVELVVVIAIIAVLAAVLIPTFTSIIKKANDSAYLQERTNQKIEDLAEKVDKINYFTWEDFEKKLAEELAKVDTTGLDETELNKAVTSAVTEAMKEYSAHSQTSTTGLTADQVKKIVDEAMAGQLTTAQVEAIVKAAVGNKSVDGNAIANQVIAKLPKTTGITKEEMQKAINEALNGVEGVTEADIAKALAAFGVSTLTEADINNIISSATADNTTLAKALNIRLNTLNIGPQNTVYDVVKKLGGESVIPKTDSTSTLLYDLENNRFFTVKDNKVDYNGGLNISDTLTNTYKYWIFSTVENATYSTYLLKDSTLTSATVSRGIDVGENTEVTSITYTNTTAAAQDVVIRTNGGTLTVNAPLDTVMHYGNADNVNIVAVASASYHENGTVPFIQISKGRIEIEATGDVNGIHVANVQTVDTNGNITKTENTFSHDVVLSLNGADVKLTRDTIGTEIATPVLVCQVQANANSDEYIWLVGDGTIENAKVYVTETNAAPDTSVASTTTTENASAAAIAIANNAVNTGSEESPAYTAVDTGVKLNTSEDQEIWATYDSQAKLEYLINNTVFVNLKQIANIVDMTSVDIPAGRTIVIDTNGYNIDAALEKAGRHYYVFNNYGQLTLQDSSVNHSSVIKARGIYNYGGLLTVDYASIYAEDTNGGACIWATYSNTTSGSYFNKADFNLDNETDAGFYNAFLGWESYGYYVEEFDYNNYSYVMKGKQYGYKTYAKTPKNAVGTVIINDGRFWTATVNSQSAPGCVRNLTNCEMIINGGTFEGNSIVYAIINDGGNMTINDANVIGNNHGALGMNYGTLTVNGGTFNANKYYGLWITNNSYQSTCTINGGTFTGELYGLNSNIDDGHQDAGDVGITINGGTFTGGTAAINAGTTPSEHVWSVAVKGGTYSSDPTKYISAGYVASETENGWIVNAN